MQFKLPPVYPITDKKLSGKTDHFSILEELVLGGARMVQIRDKTTPARDLLPDLRKCMEFAAEKDVILLINDRCDLVLSSGASGVHLGQDDLPPEAARRILGEQCVVGWSTHSLPQVRRASRLPVQYIGFGPVFATSTKEVADRVVGLRRLEKACQISSFPVVAIGGIGLREIRSVLGAGACSAAVVSALMTAPDIARRMQEFIEEATAR